MAHTPLYQELAGLIGAVFVSSQPETCGQFAIQGCVPSLVAAPASTQELATVMAAAHSHGASVAPWGGGTQQHLGNPPNQLELVVRTERLNRVLIHEPDDLTISVEAGMSLGMLHSYLANYRQTLPVDPPFAHAATIGGLLATAADGPRRLGYGTLRDLLIGISVVEVTGRVSKAGGMVVKNVSGFDMMKLYHGSFGSLAVIATANFKLLPAPRAKAIMLSTFANRAHACAMLDELHASHLTPAAVEYLSGAALAVLGFGGGCGVAVLAEGLAAAVERHSRDVAVLAKQYGGELQPIGQSEAAWTSIANLPQVVHLGSNEAVLKIATLPSELCETLDAIERFDHQAVVVAHALDGVVYARLGGLDASRLEQLHALVAGVQWVATTINGARRWGALGEGAAVMRRIKHEFDPHGLLNPGRFVLEEREW